MPDVGLTHVALFVADLEASRAFYARYAGMRSMHERTEASTGARVAAPAQRADRLAAAVGYWAFIESPDGHILELSFGQEVGLTVGPALEGERR